MKRYQFWSRNWQVVGLVFVTALLCLFLAMAITGCGGAEAAERMGAILMALVMSTWVWYALATPYAAEVTDDGLLVLHRLAGELHVPVHTVEGAFFHASKGGRLSLLLQHARGRARLEAQAGQVRDLVEDLLAQNPAIEVREARIRWPWSGDAPNGRERLRELARDACCPIFRLWPRL